jgi:hypothetical protein
MIFDSSDGFSSKKQRTNAVTRKRLGSRDWIGNGAKMLLRCTYLDVCHNDLPFTVS